MVYDQGSKALDPEHQVLNPEPCVITPISLKPHILNVEAYEQHVNILFYTTKVESGFCATISN
jgi:hypothetical protein